MPVTPWLGGDTSPPNIFTMTRLLAALFDLNRAACAKQLQPPERLVGFNFASGLTGSKCPGTPLMGSEERKMGRRRLRHAIDSGHIQNRSCWIDHAGSPTIPSI